MHARLASLALSSLAAITACSSSSGASGPIPEGDWSVTLTFTTGTCTDLPATTAIAFGVANVKGQHGGGGFTFTVETGLTGATISSTTVLACDTTSCTLDFSASGPGDEGSDVASQTITATLTEGSDDNIAGSGQIDVELTGGSDCAQSFTGSGTVTQ